MHMSEGLYELLALCARYIFAGLMVLIVVRAWRITIVDSRRAKTLRRISPETGIIGELMVMEGDEKARRGMKYKVIREGQIGSSRRADIRIRHSSVRRRHAYFLETEEGLRVRSHAGAPLRDDAGNPVKEVILQDGDNIEVGRVQLMLILSQAPAPGYGPASRRRMRRDSGPVDDMFDPDDDLFEPGEDSFEPGPFRRESIPFRDSSVRRKGGLFTDDDLFGEEDALREPPVSRPATRRHLPFTLKDGPGGASAPRPDRGRSVYSDSRRSSAFNRPGAAPRVEDNPLNRLKPRRNSDDTFTDDEMW